MHVCHRHPATDSQPTVIWHQAGVVCRRRNGTLEDVKNWWDHLISSGQAYGYHPNAAKSWLVVKETKREEAASLLEGTGIHITTQGRRLLGTAIGTRSFQREHVENTIAPLVQQLSRLSEIAKTQPHAAYATLTHGLASKWTFLSRTMDNIYDLLQPLEDCLRQHLIPNLIGRSPPGDQERAMLDLPPRHGGLGIFNPLKTAKAEYKSSPQVTAPLITKITKQDEEIGDILEDLSRQKKKAKHTRQNLHKVTASQLKTELPISQQRSLELASEKGASNWLSALPLERYSFALHKGAFRDAICLRYGWQPQHLPSHCTCGKNFTTDHAPSCPTGGYPSIRHNELRDLTANLLREVCHDVAVESHLQPLPGEQLNGCTNIWGDRARLDISACGFWGGRFEKAFYDIPQTRAGEASSIRTKSP